MNMLVGSLTFLPLFTVAFAHYLWAFGNTGPMKLQPGYEPMIQAFAGLFSVNGTADGPPAQN